VAVVALAAAGCGGGLNYAKVSGVVYLDNKPQPGLYVTFQPMGTKDNPNPGRGSYGKTDENGRYTLMRQDGTPGAVVGKHRVRINAAPPDRGKSTSETGTPDGDPKAGRVKAPKPSVSIPARYGENSTLEFTVEKGGTDQADFRLDSDKKKK
jgi:hypothetical protein